MQLGAQGAQVRGPRGEGGGGLRVNMGGRGLTIRKGREQLTYAVHPKFT